MENYSFGLETYLGEEIHLPFHQVHILNVGGTKSVNEYVLKNKEAYESEVAKIGETLQSYPLVDKEVLAQTVWAMKKTHEYGGMSIFSHPYWKRAGGYNHSTNLTDAIFEVGGFDAWELMSGYGTKESFSNTLQLEKYG